MIHNALEDKPLPVYGDGLQVRDWIHVSDHCSAILTVLENGRPGETYNVGSNCEKSNLDIVHLILHELQKPDRLITHMKDRPGHDRRYAIDNTKITTELSWTPTHTFEHGICETIQWYLHNPAWVRRITSSRSYQRYYAHMYGKSAPG